MQGITAGRAESHWFGYGPRMKITAESCRAARGLLDIRQEELAQLAGVSLNTIRNFEGGRTIPTVLTLEALARALEEAGVVFIEENGGGSGVRLRHRSPRRGDRRKIQEN
jgi:transcriptional regulator with XRE-family HTH domain